MSDTSVVIVCFRRDLRLEDNPAFHHACASGNTVLPIYIHDEAAIRIGAASKLYLYESLTSLHASLDGALRFFSGNTHDIICDLIKELDVKAVYWNRLYDKKRIEQDSAVKTYVQDQGIVCESFNASLLFEPWEIKNGSGEPYKVFTPFYRKGILAQDMPAFPRDPASPRDFFNETLRDETTLDGLCLLPEHDWKNHVLTSFTAGEKAARERLTSFIRNGLKDYKTQRNFPAASHGTSRLSASLHFGEISPRRIWHDVRNSGDGGYDEDIDCYLSEIGWREFSYTQLYYFPEMPEKPLKEKFKQMPWEHNPTALKRWKQGKTGVPIIDAAMRQLWHTGYMHNRCRMIVGSYLVKNLLIDWREGEKWFFDTLIDADHASNAAGWQWVAGSGVDAAPFFRIFNPETQSEKFDADGRYISAWVPELKKLPAKYIHAPHKAPNNVLEYTGIVIGRDYPKPLVDLKETRQRALDALKQCG